MVQKTNTQIPLEERPEADKGRKPYMAGKSYDELGVRDFLHGGSDGGSYQGMMRRDTYKYATPAQLQHSQFKKPYLGDEFIEMENFADDLQYLNFNPWHISLDLEIPPGETGGVKGAGGRCNISCWINVNDYEWSDDCSELTLYFKGDYDSNEGSKFAYENVYPRSSSHTVGRTAGITGFPQAFLVTGIGSGEQYIGTFVQDIQAFCPGSKVDCSVNFDLTPDCCTLVWDEAASQEEIDTTVDLTADVVAIGGEGSYSWAVTGDGASMAAATTTVPTNTVNLTAPGVGESCGTILVTVTSCGVTTEEWGIRIINSGSWVLVDTTACYDGFGNITRPCVVEGPADSFVDIGGAWEFEKKVGKDRLSVLLGVGNQPNCTVGPGQWSNPSYNPLTGGYETCVEYADIAFIFQTHAFDCDCGGNDTSWWCEQDDRGCGGTPMNTCRLSRIWHYEWRC